VTLTGDIVAYLRMDPLQVRILSRYRRGVSRTGTNESPSDRPDRSLPRYKSISSKLDLRWPKRANILTRANSTTLSSRSVVDYISKAIITL